MGKGIEPLLIRFVEIIRQISNMKQMVNEK